MGILWNYIKGGGTITAAGFYQTDDNGKVQTVKLAAGIDDWVYLRHIDNVVGSGDDDLLALTTPSDKNFGVISLGRGDDSLLLNTAETYYLKLTGVENVGGVAGATLKLAGSAQFATDGSVSILANDHNAAAQTITFSGIADDITVSLGKGRDKVVFTAPVAFSLDGEGQLVAHQDGHALSFAGYAGSATNLTIVVDDQSYTYRDLLASDLVDSSGPAVSIDGIATDSGATASIADGGVTKDATLELSGAVADDNGVAAVHVFDGDTDLGAATLDGLGGWSYTTAALSEATHTLTAVATDAFGNVGTSAAVSATVDTTPPTIDTTLTLYATLGDPDYFFLYFSEAVGGLEFADLSVNNGHSLGSPIDANAPEPLADAGGYMIRLAPDNTVATGDVITLVGVADLAGNPLASTDITVTVV